jgi:hypothetical protein
MSDFNKPTNPPAFPTLHIPYSSPPAWNGMTLRDYFAIRAMQELMGTADIDDCCETAYKWADEMLKAREK